MKVAEIWLGRKLTNSVLTRCKNTRHEDKRKKLERKHPKKSMSYWF